MPDVCHGEAPVGFAFGGNVPDRRGGGAAGIPAAPGTSPHWILPTSLLAVLLPTLPWYSWWRWCSVLPELHSVHL